MSDLSGDLSGSRRVNLNNPTSISLCSTTTWILFVGNVGFLRQERGPAAFREHHGVE